VGVIAGIECDVGDRLAAELELLRRPLEAQAPDVLLDRLADHAPEHSVEMVGREVGDPRQLFQGKDFIQVTLDVDEHAQDSLVVSVFGL
jgi:hypothetical protein